MALRLRLDYDYFGKAKASVVCWLRTGHGVITRAAPRVTAAKPMGCQIATFQAAMQGQRLKRVGRTRGLKPAAVTNPRRQNKPVGAHGQGDDTGQRRHVRGP